MKSGSIAGLICQPIVRISRLICEALIDALNERKMALTPLRRLLERIRTTGAASTRHKATGPPSNNRISPGMCDYVLSVELVRSPAGKSYKFHKSHYVTL